MSELKDYMYHQNLPCEVIAVFGKYAIISMDEDSSWTPIIVKSSELTEEKIVFNDVFLKKKAELAELDKKISEKKNQLIREAINIQLSKEKHLELAKEKCKLDNLDIVLDILSSPEDMWYGETYPRARVGRISELSENDSDRSFRFWVNRDSDCNEIGFYIGDYEDCSGGSTRVLVGRSKDEVVKLVFERIKTHRIDSHVDFYEKYFPDDEKYIKYKEERKIKLKEHLEKEMKSSAERFEKIKKELNELRNK